MDLLKGTITDVQSAGQQVLETADEDVLAPILKESAAWRAELATWRELLANLTIKFGS